MKHRLSINVGIALMIALGTWLLRSRACLGIVTWDEPAWVYRTASFMVALRRGDLAGTLLTGHPGVMTMWAGTLGLLWERLMTGQPTAAALELIAAQAWEIHDVALLRQLTPLLPAARRGMHLFHALITMGTYGLLTRLINRPSAIAATLLLVFSPYYAALSGLLHMDALAAGLMLWSLLAALVFARRGQRISLILSGLAGGLAALTRTTGMLILPSVVLVFMARRVLGLGNEIGGDRQPSIRHRLRDVGADMVIWGLCAAAVYLILWPAMWSSPFRTIGQVMATFLGYGTEDAGATAGFYLGHVTEQMGAGFYALGIWFRTMPPDLDWPRRGNRDVLAPQHNRHSVCKRETVCFCCADGRSSHPCSARLCEPEKV